MSKDNLTEYYEMLDGLDDLPGEGNLPRIKNGPPERPRHQRLPPPQVKAKHTQDEMLSNLADETAGEMGFEFSYNATKHERQWIIDSLSGFYQSRWFDDILRLLKGGKEASVYQCATNTSEGRNYIAAKVYRPRRFRNLKNDSLYREGRDRLDEDGNTILDGRMQHAMNKRTEFGRQLLHTSWIEHEYKTMQILHQAGADIPTPFTRGDNAILMEYIGGANTPAPTLIEIELDPPEAGKLFKRILQNVEIMLANQRVHGDLSAYNVLYWHGEINLIDFPQAIDPRQNRNAFLIFERDITRICEYFARQGVQSNPRHLARKLWKAHGFRIREQVHPRWLDGQDENDRAYWKSWKDE
jgi:RIO kinase 1